MLRLARQNLHARGHCVPFERLLREILVQRAMDTARSAARESVRCRTVPVESNQRAYRLRRSTADCGMYALPAGAQLRKLDPRQ
jgi:hypothetical protein